jgi:hypothetical protein
MPPVPFVSSSQFVASSCTRNRNAIVRITNACPRARIAITPSSAAIAPERTPATGTQTHGEPPMSVTQMPTVYAPSPTNAP